jgi:DNA-3-methyladenine glycosylase II
MSQEIANPKTLRQASEYLAGVDPALAPIIAKAGLPTITPHKNYYQELVESIVSQQLSVKAARTIMNRFLDLFEGDDFPTPAQILSKTVEEFRAVGLSRQKGTYIQDLAVKVIEGTVKFNHLDVLSNEDVIAELTQIKGVGVWTVHMFLIFCMGRLDVLPTGDLGIKNGIYALYNLKEKPSPEEMEKLAKKHKWHPYESVASCYVWHSLDNKPAIS